MLTVIQPVVECDGETGTLVNPDLDQQIVLKFLHGIAHAKRGSNSAVGRREGSHHRVADRFDDCAAFGGNDLDNPEMLAHKIVGDNSADTVIKRGRALEVGGEEGEAGNLEPLVDVKRVGSIDVAKGLIAQ